MENNKAVKQKDNSNPKPFASGFIRTIFIVKEGLQKLGAGDTWLFDLFTSRHLSNNWKLFSNLKIKSIKFVTVIGQVICTKEISTIFIPLTDGNNIELYNVALALGYDSNLISLGQLQKTGITYYNNSMAMILMKQKKVIVQAKRTHNLFTVDLAQPRIAMATMTLKPKKIVIAR